VLEDFMKLVDRAYGESPDNPEERLHDLVTGYALREKDSRINVAMRFLENEFWRLVEEYQEWGESLKRKYPVTAGV